MHVLWCIKKGFCKFSKKILVFKVPVFIWKLNFGRACSRSCRFFGIELLKLYVICRNVSQKVQNHSTLLYSTKINSWFFTCCAGCCNSYNISANPTNTVQTAKKAHKYCTLPFATGFWLQQHNSKLVREQRQLRKNHKTVVKIFKYDSTSSVKSHSWNPRKRVENWPMCHRHTLGLSNTFWELFSKENYWRNSFVQAGLMGHSKI